MAAQTGNDFEGTFNNGSTGLYKNNTAREISPTDLRALPTAIRESYLNRIDDAYTGAFPLVEITGTTAYTGTLNPAITAYTTMKIHVKAKDTSTGPVTLNLNSVGAKEVWINPTTQADTGDLVDEQEYILSYDPALGSGVWLMVAGGSGGGGGGTWGSITGTITDQTDLVSYVASQLSSAVAGLFDLRGNFDASGGAYPSSGGSGAAGAILKSDAWVISVAGTLPTGQAVSVGDLIFALQDTPGNTQANWGRVEMNLGFTPEDVANKATGFGTINNTLYPTVQAVSERISAQAPKTLVVACSDEVSPITAAANKVKFRMPYAMTLTAVRASLSTTQTSGSIFTVDVLEGGVSIFSTLLTIDNGETTSTTAATPVVISDASLADNAEISVTVTQIGDNTAKGLKINLIGS